MTVMTELERVQAEMRARDEREHAEYEERRRVKVAGIRERTGLPVGTGWRSWDDPAGTPNDPAALEALPKTARGLLDTADAAGWRWVCAWSLSSSDMPYVELVASGAGHQVQGCWHTEGSPSGRPRLFSLIARGPRMRWHDLPVKAARELIHKWPVLPPASRQEGP